MDYQDFIKIAPVSRETFEALEAYDALLLQWQQSINLISRHTVSDSWRRHILDCAQWVPLLQKASGNIVDLGSGAGLPGIIFAICGIPNISLIESDLKKCAFLKEVKRLLGLTCTILPSRIEQTLIDSPQFLTSRAIAPLEELLSLSEHLLCNDTICLFAKGKNCATEIKDAERNWAFDYQLLPSLIHPESVMLRLHNVTRR